jgi:hypothetical protein
MDLLIFRKSVSRLYTETFGEWPDRRADPYARQVVAIQTNSKKNYEFRQPVD